MKFSALVYPAKIGSAFGKKVHICEKDAIEANARFCEYCAALERHHGARFEFDELRPEE